jgi:hypothetical protein
MAEDFQFGGRSQPVDLSDQQQLDRRNDNPKLIPNRMQIEGMSRNQGW